MAASKAISMLRRIADDECKIRFLGNVCGFSLLPCDLWCCCDARMSWLRQREGTGRARLDEGLIEVPQYGKNGGFGV